MTLDKKLWGLVKQANAEQDANIYYGYLDKAKKKKKAANTRAKASRKRNRKK